MSYDPSLGIVRFTDETNKIAYQIPYRIEQFRLLPNLEKELKQSVYYKNDEDKRRGVECDWKDSWFLRRMSIVRARI